MATKRKREPAKESELWQRLRAVRTHAEITQTDMCKLINDMGLKIGRSAVALWESRDPRNRTKPGSDFINAYATICKVPVTFLLSDAHPTSDLPRFLQQEQDTKALRGKADDEARMRQVEREAKSFWSAVQHRVIVKRGDLEDCFNVPVNVAGLPQVAAFLFRKRVAAFVSDGKPDFVKFLADESGNLFLMERALQRPLEKHVLVYTKNLGVADEAQRKSFADVLGIKLLAFGEDDVQRAADCILSLAASNGKE